MSFTKILGTGISTTTNVRVGVITATKFVGDGSGLTNLSSGGISEVVSDTTPQLGGNLDLNSSDVTGTGNINITGNYTGTGSVSDSMGPVRRLGTNTQSTSYTLVAADAGKAIIRTGGDTRISNFLLYQIAYSEIHFVRKLWPDYSKQDFKRNINKYFNSERRFGERT